MALAQPTVHRWLNLLETSYLLVRLPAYAVNRTSRLIKAPKVYWGDTGVTMHLGDMANPSGAHLENLVLQDLLAWRDARIERAELGYWRCRAPASVSRRVWQKDSSGAVLHTGPAMEWLTVGIS